MSEAKPENDKSHIHHVRTSEGFLIPSGAVNPMQRPRKNWDLMDTPMGTPFNVAGPWRKEDE